MDKDIVQAGFEVMISFVATVLWVTFAVGLLIGSCIVG